jgi:hypothetical protein
MLIHELIRGSLVDGFIGLAVIVPLQVGHKYVDRSADGAGQEKAYVTLDHCGACQAAVVMCEPVIQ